MSNFLQISSKYRLEIVGRMLAPGASEIVGEVGAFVHVATDLAAPTDDLFLLGGGLVVGFGSLRLDIFEVVSVGSGGGG